jgi:hypothetical protein
MADTHVPTSNEHVLEVRYKANARMVDRRGSWADSIAKHMRLRHWKIDTNVVNVFNPGATLRVFAGYRSAGLIALDTATRNFFPDTARELLECLTGLDGFRVPIEVERLGVRSKFCTPYEGSFDDLRDRCVSKYAGPTEAALEAIGSDARLTDVGAPLNFEDSLGSFNSGAGPMKRDQLVAFFQKDDGFPEVGLFYDIDYWVQPPEPLSGREVIRLTSAFAQAAWDRHERVRDLILGTAGA